MSGRASHRTSEAVTSEAAVKENLNTGGKSKRKRSKNKNQSRKTKK